MTSDPGLSKYINMEREGATEEGQRIGGKECPELGDSPCGSHLGHSPYGGWRGQVKVKDCS